MGGAKKSVGIGLDLVAFERFSYLGYIGEVKRSTFVDGEVKKINGGG